MNMIEKVARALLASLASKHIFHNDFDSLIPSIQEDFRDQARAAILAMRDPTDAMIEAGMDYDERELNIRLGRAPTVEECQAGEWQAQIDAALSEAPEGKG